MSNSDKRPLVTLVAGARPNFMKIAPIVRALEPYASSLRYEIVHTGQHYDHAMSNVFFDELGIPEPDCHLECGGGSHAAQTAKILLGFEEYCQKARPRLVLVVGDVNSTLACAIVAKKMDIDVAHVEAGLRSGDLTMPEEINRRVTDSISDLFFVTEPSGMDNLRKEGNPTEKIHFVGHVMIDNLFYQMEKLKDNSASFPSSDFKLQHAEYGVVTLHRPSNVDIGSNLREIMEGLAVVAGRIPLVFSVHPRTKEKLDSFRIHIPDGITTFSSLPYMEFLDLWKDARLVLTDSGGLQEETTALGVPCLTIRDNTERPITVHEGTNVLVGRTAKGIADAAWVVLERSTREEIVRPHLWDGHAADRIVKILHARVCA